MPLTYTYLNLAVDRVLEAWKQFELPNAEFRVCQHAQKYLFPTPTRFPCVCLYPSGITHAPAGNPQDEVVATVTMRYLIGNIHQGLVGEYQARLWMIIPYVIHWFNTYPNLIWESGQTQIPYLQPDGASVENTTRLGVFRNDDEHVGVEIPLTLRFMTYNEELSYG
jgi:hypothetical protein